MKLIYFFPVFLAAMIFAGCTKPPPPVATAPPPDYRAAIAAACQQVSVSVTNCITITHGQIDETASDHKLAALLRATPVNQCPQDFRVAWVNLVHSLENYDTTENAIHTALAGTAAAAHTSTGGIFDGPAKKALSQIVTQKDIKDAWDALEIVSAKYNGPGSAN